MKAKLPNWEVAVYSLHILGGISDYVGTEQIALKCFELAPDSFSWVTRPDMPDKDVARSALMDARKPKNGNLVTGRAGRGKGHAKGTATAGASDGWILTEAGVNWVGENAERLSDALKYREASGHRQEQLQKLNRLRAHRLFREYLDQPQGFNPAIGDMAELFRCRVDSARATWDKRLQSASNLARGANDDEVLSFVRKCGASLESQMNMA